MKSNKDYKASTTCKLKTAYLINNSKMFRARKKEYGRNGSIINMNTFQWKV